MDPLGGAPRRAQFTSLQRRAYRFVGGAALHGLNACQARFPDTHTPPDQRARFLQLLPLTSPSLSNALSQRPGHQVEFSAWRPGSAWVSGTTGLRMPEGTPFTLKLAPQKGTTRVGNLRSPHHCIETASVPRARGQGLRARLVVRGGNYLDAPRPVVLLLWWALYLEDGIRREQKFRFTLHGREGF